MLDIHTILILLSVNGLTVAIGLLCLRAGEVDSAALPWWAAGFLTGAAGILLLLTRNYLPDVILVDLMAIDLANLLTLLGFACWISGSYRFTDRPLRLWALLPAAIWLIGLTVPVIRETFFLRVALVHGASAVGYFQLCAIFAGRPSGIRRPGGTGARLAGRRRPIALVLLVAGIWSAAAGIAALWLEPATLGHSLVNLVGAAVSVLLVLLVVIYGIRLIQERSEERLRDLAVTDPLTGVLNRRGLSDRLDNLLRPDQEAAGHIALLVCDLDHFKAVNDRYGHQAGDDVLLAFCRRTERQLRPEDLFGRLGGEEFAAVLRVSDTAQALAVAERIRAAAAEPPVTVDGQIIPVTVSIGVAILHPGDRDSQAALKAADRALYAAKAAGRNRVLMAPDRLAEAPPA